MMRVESCEYNMDTGCIDVVYANGKILSIYVPAIEESLHTTVYSRSRLDLLLDSDPLCYVEMVLDGTLQEWVDQIDRSSQGQLNCYIERLSEQYPVNVAEDIAREIMMYQ